MKLPGLGLRTSHRLLAASLGLAIPFGISLALADPPAAGSKPPQTKEGGGISAKSAHEQELEGVRGEQLKAADAEAKLTKELEAIAADRRQLNDDLITTASRIRVIEDRMTATELRLQKLTDNEVVLRGSLAARRGNVVEILAALQRLGRSPPRPILVAPQDALAGVRTAMLLGAVLPEMQTKSAQLADELGELGRLRQAMATERDGLTHDLATLALDRQRLGLLIDERQSKLADTQTALESERQRAAGLARQADSLKDLIAKLQQNGPASGRSPNTIGRGQSAKEIRSNLTSLRDPGRLVPAMAFAAARGALPLPVNGVRIRDFGAPDGLGGTEKGLWIASRPTAQVTAPCDGWVVYAGPFRSYGQLLILNAGDGYHVLLAGMERSSVDLGQFVLTGEPVAVMGAGPQSAAAVTIGSNQPVLYVEFRKDGTPVDPSPWWATTESEKVRG
jgi:murein hydrolase activator